MLGKAVRVLIAGLMMATIIRQIEAQYLPTPIREFGWGTLESSAMSPDGNRLATGGWDGTVRIWDVDTSHVLRKITAHNNVVCALAFSRDGKRFLTGSYDKTARLWDTDTGQMLREFTEYACQAHGLAFTPDGRILSGSSNNTVILWDPASGESLRTFQHQSLVHAIAVSPDGTRLLTGSLDAQLWDLETGELLRTLTDHTDRVISVAFSPDGTRIATGSEDYTAKLWVASTGQCLRTFSETANKSDVRSVCFSPDGTKLLTGHYSDAQLWDAATGAVLKKFTDQRRPYVKAMFRAGRNQVLTRNQTAMLWDIGTGQRITDFAGYNQTVSDVAFTADGFGVLCGYAGGEIKLWDRNTGQVLRDYSQQYCDYPKLDFSRDGKRLLIGGGPDLKIIELATGEVRYVGTANHALSFKVYDAVFSMDGKKILTTKNNMDFNITLWDTVTGTMIRNWYPSTTQAVYSPYFSPDGTKALTQGKLGIVDLWDTETGLLLRTFEKYSYSTRTRGFSPDGTMVLIIDVVARLLDVNTGQLIRTFAVPDVNLSSATFTPDGKWILVGSNDNAFHLFEVETGALLQTIQGHNLSSHITFSNDGLHFLTSYSGSVRLWSVPNRAASWRDYR